MKFPDKYLAFLCILGDVASVSCNQIHLSFCRQRKIITIHGRINEKP